MKLVHSWYFYDVICLLIVKICNPYPPAVPNPLFPLNGEYVSDVQFSLSFFASGSFGTVCQPQIAEGYYRVLNKYINILTKT